VRETPVARRRPASRRPTTPGERDEPRATERRRVLSAVEFDVVWEALGLGPTPVVLQLASPGRTHTERRRIVADTWSALHARRLTGPAGPEAEVEAFLRLLAGPAARVELRAWGRSSVRAVAVATPGGEGVLARRRGDDVVLDPCPSLPSAVVGLLPPAVPGPGRAAGVPTAALAAAGVRPSSAGLRPDLIDHGAAPDEAGAVARMLHGVDARAQVGVLAADAWGVLRRSPDVLDVVDGPRGRYLVTRSADGWTTVAPTDALRLRHRIAQLLTGPQPSSGDGWAD
jgi:hypothetical protein